MAFSNVLGCLETGFQAWNSCGQNYPPYICRSETKISKTGLTGKTIYMIIRWKSVNPVGMGLEDQFETDSFGPSVVEFASNFKFAMIWDHYFASKTHTDI